jgi:hypothetical protein
LFTLLIAFSFSASGYAAEALEGYVIMSTGDTVQCKFDRKSLKKFSPFYEVRVVMDNGEEQTFLAREKKILGYGFTELGIKYDFWYI